MEASARLVKIWVRREGSAPSGAAPMPRQVPRTERCAHARTGALSPCLTAHRIGERPDDRQADPELSGRAAARCVHTVEPLEDSLQLVGLEARSLDRHRARTQAPAARRGRRLRTRPARGGAHSRGSSRRSRRGGPDQPGPSVAGRKVDADAARVRLRYERRAGLRATSAASTGPMARGSCRSSARQQLREVIHHAGEARSSPRGRCHVGRRGRSSPSSRPSR